MSLKQKSEKAYENKKKHSILHLLAGIAILFIAVYTVYSIITDNIAIRKSNRRLEELNVQIKSVEEQNEQINGYLENKDNLNDYIEEIARDKLDYANTDERVFYIVPSAE